MKKQELIEEILKAFEDEKYPGDLNLVYDNTGKHLECIEIRELFKNKEWQSLPNNFMFEEYNALNFFSKEGFKYYAPAFMIFSLKEYAESDEIPSSLVYHFTLLTEIDTIILAQAIKKYKLDKEISEIDFNEVLQNNIKNIDKSINLFFQKVKMFTKEQSQAILEFLKYINNNHANDFFNNEPKTAIDRYWFMFE